MNRDSMEALRLDRRLIHRRNWIAKDQLDREIEALPDSAAKATTLGEVADEAESNQAKAKGSKTAP